MMAAIEKSVAPLTTIESLHCVSGNMMLMVGDLASGVALMGAVRARMVRLLFWFFVLQIAILVFNIFRCTNSNRLLYKVN